MPLKDYGIARIALLVYRELHNHLSLDIGSACTFRDILLHVISFKGSPMS